MIVLGCENSDFSHDYLMRGKIITAFSDDVVVCVGTSDGAEFGQVLTAYRFVMNDGNDEGADFSKGLGSVDLSRLYLQLFVRYLYKAEPL